MQIVLAHYGSVWVRIGARGNYVHTAFARPASRKKVRFAACTKCSTRSTNGFRVSKRRPRSYARQKGFVNVGCIRGGYPWRASRTPDRTDVFLDLRVPPTYAAGDSAPRRESNCISICRRNFPRTVSNSKLTFPFPARKSSENHELVKTIDAAHTQIMGSARRSATQCSGAPTRR